MKLADLKISVRLAGLSGFLIIGALMVGAVGWNALRDSNARLTESAERAAKLEHAVDVARIAQVNFKTQIQEWKNILLRGRDAEAFDKYLQAFTKKGQETQASLKELQDTLAGLGVTTPLVMESEKALRRLEDQYLEALAKFDPQAADGSQVVDALVKGMDRAPTKNIDDIVAFVSKTSLELHDKDLKDAEADYRATLNFLIATIGLAALLGIVATYWIIRSITRPLHEAIAVAETVASGDLTLKITVHSKDETGQLLSALKHMNESLVTIVGQVRRGTDNIANGSGEIAAGNLDLSSRTEEQASSLEETASSMEQLTATVRQNADDARLANELAISASAVAMQGGEVVSQVVQTMEAINQSAARIGDIISVIDGIAFQTNILALNAAVEAARAGEQGRGFAVVATEVRSLAQRSAAAAKEIKELIGASVDSAQAGSKLVADAGDTMTKIVSSVQQVADIIGRIQHASQEQSTGIAEVDQAIGQIDQATQQNAALVEEAAAAAQSLQNQADILADAVRVFKVDSQREVLPMHSERQEKPVLRKIALAA
jgi:methyl-accepting chemotaxis protein